MGDFDEFDEVHREEHFNFRLRDDGRAPLSQVKCSSFIFVAETDGGQGVGKFEDFAVEVNFFLLFGLEVQNLRLGALYFKFAGRLYLDSELLEGPLRGDKVDDFEPVSLPHEGGPNLDVFVFVQELLVLEQLFFPLPSLLIDSPQLLKVSYVTALLYEGALGSYQVLPAETAVQIKVPLGLGRHVTRLVHKRNSFPPLDGGGCVVVSEFRGPRRDGVPRHLGALHTALLKFHQEPGVVFHFFQSFPQPSDFLQLFVGDKLNILGRLDLPFQRRRV